MLSWMVRLGMLVSGCRVKFFSVGGFFFGVGLVSRW